MLSAIFFIISGVAIGFGLWSAVLTDITQFTAVYYICAVVCLGMAISLRRYRL